MQVLLAQDRAEIRVERIVPERSTGALTVSAHFSNLFSRRIVGTIQSGLPSIIEVDIRLIDNANHNVARRRLSRSLSYDLWEERYTLTFGDSTLAFKDFEAVKAFCNRIDSEVVAPLHRLQPGKRYRLKLRVAIVPITARQVEKVSNWLEDPNQSDEYIASDERASGFQLNLNKLVSFFVSSRKRSVFSSTWFSSPEFTVNDLQE